MSVERLSDLEGLSLAATPGPWKARDDWGVALRGGENHKAWRRFGGRQIGSPVIFRCQSQYDMGSRLPKPERLANCLFAAEARAAVPELIAEVYRLRALLLAAGLPCDGPPPPSPSGPKAA